jgi:hypothetical protein
LEASWLYLKCLSPCWNGWYVFECFGGAKMFVTTLAWGTNNVFVMSSRFHMGYTLQKFESFKQMCYKFLNLATFLWIIKLGCIKTKEWIVWGVRGYLGSLGPSWNGYVPKCF